MNFCVPNFVGCGGLIWERRKCLGEWRRAGDLFGAGEDEYGGEIAIFR
jgi:hypothetical protein